MKPESKEMLYFLLREYINDKINTLNFTNNFTVIFNTETDYNELNKLEQESLEDLSSITSRFSPYKEDFENSPNTFYNENQVRKKAAEIWYILNQK